MKSLENKGSAGTGRQARLRILWVYARVGSSPISRIKSVVYLGFPGDAALFLFASILFFIDKIPDNFKGSLARERGISSINKEIYLMKNSRMRGIPPGKWNSLHAFT